MARIATRHKGYKGGTISEEEKKKGIVSVARFDCNSSLETIVDDSLSSSEDGTEDSNISFSDDDSLDVIEPVVAPFLDIKHLPVSPDLSMDTTPTSDADSSVATAIGFEETKFNSGPNISVVSPSLLAGVSFRQLMPSLPSPSILPVANPPRRQKSSSVSQTNQQATAPTPMAMIVMTSSRGPDGNDD